MRNLTMLLTAALASTLVACSDSEPVPSVVEGGGMTGTNLAVPASATTTPAKAALTAATDQTLITLSGTVAMARPEGFQLDVGGERIRVEMDDWDWYDEGRALKNGDRVTVTGRVDKGLWEQSKIEASSVYVRNLGVTFFASAADEEATATASAMLPLDIVTTALGPVTAVEGRELTIGSPTGAVRVDASQLNSPPQVKVGDRVHAWGDVDIDPVEGTELKAQGMVLLTPSSPQQAPAQQS